MDAMLAQWVRFNRLLGARRVSGFDRSVASGNDAVRRTKRDLRTAVLAARRTARSEDQDSRVREALRAWIVTRVAGTVAAYVPMPGEPGGPTLPAMLAECVPRVLLPILRNDFDLDWADYDGTLVPVSRGLSEPTGPRLGPFAITQADVVIVPGLAVDRDGVRLGRGGGSYDRALARIDPSALVITLLYDGELLDHIPAEPHDRPVSGVIRPGTGVTLFSS